MLTPVNVFRSLFRVGSHQHALDILRPYFHWAFLIVYLIAPRRHDIGKVNGEPQVVFRNVAIHLNIIQEKYCQLPAVFYRGLSILDTPQQDIFQELLLHLLKNGSCGDVADIFTTFSLLFVNVNITPNLFQNPFV